MSIILYQYDNLVNGAKLVKDQVSILNLHILLTYL